MTSNRPSVPISKNSRSRPINVLRLAAYGPTDADDHIRRQTKNKIIYFVRRLFIEKKAREVSKDETEKVEEESGEPFEEWLAPELVYEIQEKDREEEKGEEEEEEKEEEGEEEEDEETGGMEIVGLVGPGMESMEHVLPTLEPDGDIFSTLDISQEGLENYEPFADICGECLDRMDILEELFGSDLENGK